MDLLNGIIRDRGSDLIGELTSKAGLSTDQASRFLPAAGSSVIDTLTSHASDLDVGDLSSASSIGAITKHLDVGALAGQAGVTAEQSAKGLSAILPMFMGLIGDRAKGAGGLLSLLGAGGSSGGGLDALKGVAGKFLGGR